MVETTAEPESGTSESASFERFFEGEYARLARALYLVTGDAHEGEDLAQEAMVRILERWEKVSVTRAPVGYLYRTALNLHRSRLRRRNTRRRRTPGPTPDDPLGPVEDRHDIGELLATLPPGQREALVLVEWLGMTPSEAAAVLGIQPVSVRVRLSRAKTTLRSSSPDLGGAP